MIGGIGGYGAYVRNLSRNPGYGLRGKRKDYDSKNDRPVGPRLVKGRGLRRRRAPVASASYVIILLTLTALVGVIVIRFLQAAT